MVTRTSPGRVSTTSVVTDPTTSDDGFIMDQAPIYARPRQKSAKSKLAMFAVPAALVLTAGIVLATSQPRSNAQQPVPTETAQAAPAAKITTPPPAVAPAPLASAAPTTAAAPVSAPKATPAPARRTASTASRRAVESPASAPDVNSAAQDTSAVIAPAPAPVTAPTPPTAVPEVVAPAAPEGVAPTQPEPMTAPPAAEAAPTTPAM